MNDDIPDATPATPPPVPQTPQGTQPIRIEMRQPRGGSLIGRLFVGLVSSVLIISIVLNVYLLTMVSASVGTSIRTQVVTEGNPGETIALYDVQGMITPDQARRFDLFAREVIAEDDVKAVVIRVNSPGGAVAPSDEMNAAMNRLKAAGKTVVVSMGGVAASGGYYLSAPAHDIYAEPTTITGSIGVISQMPILVGTMEKIGMEMVVMRSEQAKEYKAGLNPFEHPTDQVKAEFQEMLNTIQGLFVQAVTEGRSMLTAEEVAALSNGKVWVGTEAKAKKLVDAIGYLADAIDGAGSRAGLMRPHVVRYQPRYSLMQMVLGAKASEGAGVTIDADLLDELQTPRVLMLWRP
ncbi:MAG: signal peptide peptidase SppA [Planctomycetota bacterium]